MCFTVGQLDDEDGDVSSYREFSLMAIANRSLDMSRSLTERCSKFADLQLVDDCGVLSPSEAVVSTNQHSPNTAGHDETITVGVTLLFWSLLTALQMNQSFLQARLSVNELCHHAIAVASVNCINAPHTDTCTCMLM